MFLVPKIGFPHKALGTLLPRISIDNKQRVHWVDPYGMATHVQRRSSCVYARDIITIATRNVTETQKKIETNEVVTE